MLVISKSNFIHISPRKIRLVAKNLRGLPPQIALEKLKFVGKTAVIPLIDVLRQAIGNAKNNYKLDINSLIIKEILISEGPRIKRMDKAHGARFDRGIKQKRMSHIRITLEEKKLVEITNKQLVNNK